MNKTVEKWFEEHKEKITKLKQEYWSHPETAFLEYFAANRTAQYLRNHGFEDVTEFDAEGKGNPANTVIAKYGSKGPVVGILGEFDALPGLGQEAVPYPAPIEGPGHGCGHCLMATASVTAAVAIKEAIEKEQIEGQLVYIGCPAEETLAGKAILARDGYFDGLDIALIWHPGGSNMNFATGKESAATTNILFEFRGKAAHAGRAWEGRSALDAAELMNVGVNYLREHVTEDSRLHYTYRFGGDAPNIVPDYASVYYFIRSREENNEELVRRVKKVAEGAALMTDTTVSFTVEAGCHSYRSSKTLSKYGREAALKVPPIEYTEEEYEFAREIYKNTLGQEPPEDKDRLLPNKVGDIDPTPAYGGGSTDVGDTARICPTIQLFGYGSVIGLPGHHWNITAAAGTSIGLKAAIQAGKILAQFALDAFENPSLIEEAKVEFKNDYPEPYKCKIEN